MKKEKEEGKTPQTEKQPFDGDMRMQHEYLLPIIALLFSVTASGQNAAQVAKELVRQGVPHAQIVLAQARLESGNFTSRRCREDHNIFGLKRGKRYAKYARWQDCVADYKQRISSRYQGGDYYAFLSRIGYAKDPAYPKKVKKIVMTSK